MVLGDSDLPEARQPGVVVKKPIGQQATSAQDEFQDFGGLNRSDHSRQRPDDPGLLAAGNQPRRRRLFKYASITGALPRQDGEDTTIESQNPAVNQRLFSEETGVIDKELGRKVIHTVHDDIVPADNLESVVGA